MPAWHGDLQDRPAALDEAREAAELAAARARQAAAAAETRTSPTRSLRQARGKPPTDGQR